MVQPSSENKSEGRMVQPSSENMSEGGMIQPSLENMSEEGMVQPSSIHQLILTRTKSPPRVVAMLNADGIPVSITVWGGNGTA